MAFISNFKITSAKETCKLISWNIDTTFPAHIEYLHKIHRDFINLSNRLFKYYKMCNKMISFVRNISKRKVIFWTISSFVEKENVHQAFQRHITLYIKDRYCSRTIQSPKCSLPKTNGEIEINVHFRRNRMYKEIVRIYSFPIFIWTVLLVICFHHSSPCKKSHEIVMKTTYLF